MLTTTHNTSILTPFYEWGNISPKSHCKKKITEQDLDLVYLNTQMVNRLPTMQETWVLSLGREDFAEEGMATHSSILAWRIPWTEELGGRQSTGSQRVRHDWGTDTNQGHYANMFFCKIYTDISGRISETKTWRAELSDGPESFISDSAVSQTLQQKAPISWAPAMFLTQAF